MKITIEIDGQQETVVRDPVPNAGLINELHTAKTDLELVRKELDITRKNHNESRAWHVPSVGQHVLCISALCGENSNLMSAANINASLTVGKEYEVQILSTAYGPTYTPDKATLVLEFAISITDDKSNYVCVPIRYFSVSPMKQ